MRVGLSTFSCPEGKEACVTLGCGILAATSEDGRAVVGASQVLQDVPEQCMVGKICLWSQIDLS